MEEVPGAPSERGPGAASPDGKTHGGWSRVWRSPRPASGAQSLRAYVARSAAVCVAGLALNQTASQVGSAALARWIPSPQLYGEVSLLLQFLQLAGLALGLGLDSALVYDIATGRPQPGRSFAAARGGMLGLGALPVALCVLAAPFIARAYGVPALTVAVRIGAFALLAQVALNVATALQTGLRRFSTQMALMVCGTALAAVGRVAAIPAALAGVSVGWIALAGGGGTAVAAVVGLRLADRLRLPGAAVRPREILAEIPRMLRYGWPLWANNLLKAFQNPYLVLIAGATGVAAAGYVANDVALLGWAFLVTWAVRLVAVPLIAAGSDAADRRTRLTVCFRLNHLALFPIVAILIFWPHALVTAIYGARYATGAALLPLLVLGVYGSSIGRLTTDALAAVAQTHASVPIMLIACAPLLLGIPLEVRHGAMWLAWLYCGGWIASAAYALWQLWRIELPVDVRAGFVEPLLPTAAALPLALWGTHRGGAAGLGLVSAAVVVFCVLTVAVYRMQGRPGRGVAVMTDLPAAF